MITKQDIMNLCELIQCDLDCILDGFDNKIIEDCCQVVVDRCKVVKEKLEEN